MLSLGGNPKPRDPFQRCSSSRSRFPASGSTGSPPDTRPCTKHQAAVAGSCVDPQTGAPPPPWPPGCRCLEKGKGDKPILLPHIIQDELCKVCDECNNPALRNSELAMLLKTVQEAVVIPPRIAFALRPTMGEWFYIR